MAVNPSAVQFLALTGGTVSGNLTVTGSETVTAGPLTVTAGGLTVSAGGAAVTGSETITSGNLDVATAGNGLRVAEGSNAKQGTATLVAGTVTVANTSVTATSRIFLTGQVLGGTAGGLNVTSRVAGTSFTVTSTNAADTSTFAYEIIEVG